MDEPFSVNLLISQCLRNHAITANNLSYIKKKQAFFVTSLQKIITNTMMGVVMGVSRLQFFKNTFWVGFFTSVSRILGYLRERLVSHFLGVGAETDALLIAIKIPAFFRRVLAEGAFSSSFLPILADTQKEDTNTQRSFIITTLVFLALILVPLAIAFEVWADSIITFCCPNWPQHPLG